MERFSIYVGGSSHNGSGSIGGSAFTVFSSLFGKMVEGEFFSPRTTSNRAELLAICEGIKHVPEGHSVTIYSNNEYILLSGNKWVQRWAKSDWKRKKLKGKKGKKKPARSVAHKDLWQFISEQMLTKKVSFLSREHHRCPEMLHVHQMAREQMILGESRPTKVAA